MNSLTLPGYFDYFLENSTPAIVHGHSLDQYLSGFPFKRLENRIKRAGLFISVSEAQKQTVIKIAEPASIRVLNPPLLLNELPPASNCRSTLRQKYGIPPEAFVWAMASVYFNYNKSPLRFVELASRIIKQSDRPVFFIWIGGDVNETACRIAVNQAKSLGIEQYIRFTGNTGRKEYFSLLQASDAFLLVSLQESFSIVSAEAIALGKPVISFDCGGTREIITPENGSIIPGFSTDEMAKIGPEIRYRSDRTCLGKAVDRVPYCQYEY
ncbi:MAG: glycosyltransferase family 4 protein, partial [Bacteroidetes bacterium]|nr:glycosyltransferase family 4 protein [Bacteroidota bacterium]